MSEALPLSEVPPPPKTLTRDQKARLLFGDRQETRQERNAFEKARRTEIGYARRLRQVANTIGDLVDGFDADDASGAARIVAALRKYAEVLRPWAEAVGAAMVEEAARRDEAAWARYSREMGARLKQEIRKAPVGDRMRELMAEQVRLITSLPLEAAQRVHEQATEALVKGERASELAARIMETGHVTRSRANLIARTETGRVASVLTQARAEAIGSEGYVWRTAKDAQVRPSHKAMEGKRVLWSDPPVLDNLQGHAGALPNCRCYAEPIIPND